MVLPILIRCDFCDICHGCFQLARKMLVTFAIFADISGPFLASLLSKSWFLLDLLFLRFANKIDPGHKWFYQGKYFWRNQRLLLKFRRILIEIYGIGLFKYAKQIFEKSVSWKSIYTRKSLKNQLWSCFGISKTNRSEVEWATYTTRIFVRIRLNVCLFLKQRWLPIVRILHKEAPSRDNISVERP